MSEAQILNADRATDPIAEQVVDALRAALGERLVGVALFGSRARGDARPESDWDFLVVAEDLPEGALARHIFLKRSLPGSCRAAASLLAVTPDEFGPRESSLYLDIALDSRVLYDSRGELAERLTSLTRTMRELGLYRERTPEGDTWRQTARPEASAASRAGVR